VVNSLSFFGTIFVIWWKILCQRWYFSLAVISGSQFLTSALLSITLTMRKFLLCLLIKICKCWSDLNAIINNKILCLCYHPNKLTLQYFLGFHLQQSATYLQSIVEDIKKSIFNSSSCLFALVHSFTKVT